MKASKVMHKNEQRIKVDFPFNYAIANKIRQIVDARWSRTFNAWHIPYTKETFQQLKNLFPEIEYPKKTAIVQTAKVSTSVQVPIPLDINIPKSITKPQNVSVMVFGRKIAIKLPKNEVDIRFILGLRYSRWDKAQFCWIVPNYPLKNDYFATKTQRHEDAQRKF